MTHLYRRCPCLCVRYSRQWLVGGGVVLSLYVSAVPIAAAHEALHQPSSAATTLSTAEQETVPGRLTIPNVILVNQYGVRVHVYNDLIKDKLVVINFIFTTCSTVCPPLGAHFAALQKLLGERGGQDVSLISISVDPVVDTPPRLQAWSAQFKAGPGWTLLTGPKPEVHRLLRALHVFTPDKQTHTPTVLIGNDATGIWRRSYGLVSPATLADILAGVRSAAMSPSSAP